MVDTVFLTDARKDALNHYDPENSNHRAHKSRTKSRAKQALDELLWVASSNEIENSDVFEEEKMHSLLVTLLVGAGGVTGDDLTGISDEIVASTPDPDYRNSLYVAIENAQLHVERSTEPSDLYEMYGERAASLRDEHSEDDEEASSDE